MDRDDQQPGPSSTPDVGGADAVPSDPLLELRAALDGIDELPLEERAAVFDRTHSVVVEELRALELG